MLHCRLRKSGASGVGTPPLNGGERFSYSPVRQPSWLHSTKARSRRWWCDVDDEEHNVLVFRGDRPVAVPESVVLDAQREYRAWKLHEGGTSWDVIAATEKYPSADAARQDVRRYLTEGKALVTEWSRTELLSIKLAQLDTLLSFAWEGAKAGKLPAINTAADLIMKQAKLLRLDEAGAEDESRARTVVVQGETVSYIDSLEEAIKD